MTFRSFGRSAEAGCFDQPAASDKAPIVLQVTIISSFGLSVYPGC
jgi:hypothetical protein